VGIARKRARAMDVRLAMLDDGARLTVHVIVALAAVAAIVAIVCWHTFDLFVPLWLHPRGFYSHGFLLLAMVVLLLRERRFELFEPGKRTSILFVPLLAAAGLGWSVGWLGSVQTLELVSFFFICVFSAGLLLPRHALVAFVAPFSLLLFSLPVWHGLMPVLVSMATTVVGSAFAAAGLTVFIEGSLISVPSGNFLIASSCSGLGFLLVSLSISGYLALSNRCTPGRTLAIALLAVAMGALINWIRIFLIVLAGYYGGMDHILVHEHVWFGWVVFAILYLPYMWLLMRKVGERRTPTQSGVFRGRVSLSRLAIALLAAIGIPLIAHAITWRGEDLPVHDIVLPEKVGEYHKHDSAKIVWSPWFRKADHREWTGYRSDSHTLYAYTATYQRQGEPGEVINSVNRLYGRKWRQIGESRVLTDPPTTEILLSHRSTSRPMLLWYWYLIGDRRVALDWEAKLEQMRQMLLGRRDARVVVLASPCEQLTQSAEPSCQQARTRIEILSQAIIE